MERLTENGRSVSYKIKKIRKLGSRSLVKRINLLEKALSMKIFVNIHQRIFTMEELLKIEIK